MRQCDQRSRLVALILADMFGPLVGAVGSDLLVFGTKTFGQITASTGDIWNDLFRIHFQFRIRIQPILFRHYLEIIFFKTSYIQSKRRIYLLSAFFYFTLQSCSTHSPEYSGLN